MKFSSSFIFCFLVFLVYHLPGLALPCAPRQYGTDQIVCVCNVTYCDTLDGPNLSSGTAYVVQSSKHGERFASSNLNWTESITENLISSDNVIQIEVNSSQEFQEIIGFGGAFTDASGINFVSLPESMRNSIVGVYYSRNGSEYNIGRVPMASCDFSTHPYSYADTPGDLDLEHFQLAEEDFKYKIPFIQKAISLATQPLLLFASPWAPPAWMKTNEKMNGSGKLKGDVGGQYYQTWANYFVKFLQEYEKHNLTFWGLTAQNEPMDGFIPYFSFQCLAFDPNTQATFIAENLGPSLQQAGYGTDKVKLMIMDDQRIFLPYWAKKVFSNDNAKNYVSGIAFHWYANMVAPASLLDGTHDLFPDKFLLASEACEGSMPWQLEKVVLGDWGRAESYAHDILQDLLHWTTGWVDWNLALNLEGGPNWVKNFVDSPVVVNATGAEFYKQPMYYALAHFSKFVKRGSKRVQIDTTESGAQLELVAFKNPDNTLVLVALNRKGTPFNLEIKDSATSRSIQNVVPAHSIQTYIWNQDSAIKHVSTE